MLVVCYDEIMQQNLAFTGALIILEGRYVAEREYS